MRRSQKSRKVRLFPQVVAGLALVFLAPSHGVQAQSPLQVTSASTIYESAYWGNKVETFSSRGTNLGSVATVTHPTGLAFDSLGNLYISSDDRPNYKILKVAPDGTVTTFASTGLGFPHGLVFDTAGNLFVANSGLNIIRKFAPDGTSTVFADESDGLSTPIDLIFDRVGNLYVSNGDGGPSGTGSVLKFTPDGSVSTFADSGFQTAYGLAFDHKGNLYVSNADGGWIEKFSRTGADLGVFGTVELSQPLGIVFDRAGNLYIANSKSNNIEKLSPTGDDLGVFATTSFAPHFLKIVLPAHAL